VSIGLGTMASGWRIVKTMGNRLTKLRPVGGFCAETAGAVMLLGTAVGDIPISTSHTITGSMMGVAATQRLSVFRWGVAGRIVWARILTIPLSTVLAAATWLALPHG
jgi:PiT family inorganic phosphate transporter